MMIERGEDQGLPNRSGRQRQRTRTALLTAGQRLFATRPVEGVTIDQIVAVADVAKGSFYNHFVDKDALADAVLELIQGDIEVHIVAANQDVRDPAYRAARALCTVIRYAEAYPERVQAAASLGRPMFESDSLNVGVVADVRHGLEQGRMRGIDVETGVMVVIGLARAAITHGMGGDGVRSVETLAADVGTAALRALGVDFEEAGEIARTAARGILGGESSMSVATGFPIPSYGRGSRKAERG